MVLQSVKRKYLLQVFPGNGCSRKGLCILKVYHMQFQVIFSDLCTGGDRKALAGSFHLGQTIPIVHSYTKSVMATYRQSYKLLDMQSRLLRWKWMPIYKYDKIAAVLHGHHMSYSHIQCWLRDSSCMVVPMVHTFPYIKLQHHRKSRTKCGKWEAQQRFVHDAIIQCFYMANSINCHSHPSILICIIPPTIMAQIYF